MKTAFSRSVAALYATLFITTAHGEAVVAADAARGEVSYQSRCTACHSLDHSRIGPAHRGVFGRRVAQVDGFDYSPALKRSSVIWTAQALDRWLADPETFIPGQRMGYSVPDPNERADIIAFLASPAAR